MAASSLMSGLRVFTQATTSDLTDKGLHKRDKSI